MGVDRSPAIEKATFSLRKVNLEALAVPGLFKDRELL
jgi:hypothetical protein